MASLPKATTEKLLVMTTQLSSHLLDALLIKGSRNASISQTAHCHALSFYCSLFSRSQDILVAFSMYRHRLVHLLSILTEHHGRLFYPHP